MRSISSIATGATAYLKMICRPTSLKPITTSSLPEERDSVVLSIGDACRVRLVARILHERNHTPAVPFFWSWALRMSNVSVHCFEIVIHCPECRRFCARPLGRAATTILPSPGTPGEGPGVRAVHSVADCPALTPNPSPGVPGEGGGR